MNQGALLTEYFHDVPGNAENFPSRNRIVAGLCDGLIVVESGFKGGSMITADIAHSYDKTVFALPGGIHQNFSKGCNMLIKLNKAHLIENIGDLIYHLNWDIKQLGQKEVAAEMELGQDEKKIVELIAQETIGIDRIYQDCKLPMSKLSLLLLDLEFKNVIQRLPGKQYRLKA